MKYEDLIIIRNNYNKALKFLGELNYKFTNINDRLHFSCSINCSIVITT
jgi:hypothetical protein